jgi:hypothetical protein
MSLLSAPSAQATDGFVDAFDGRYYRIADSTRLPPFFMNVVSSADLWLFLASNGGLTAGRVNAEGALFPYEPVDRIYDSANVTGPFTAVRVMRAHAEHVWHPFTAMLPGAPRPLRNLYKSVEGDRVWFEEINEPLGLIFRYGWSMAEEHGFIRQCALENIGDEPASVHLLDGLRNLLPPNINRRLQGESSCLVDAYKTAELIPGTTLATYSLSAGITDRATPLESLRASIVWSTGLPDAEILLSTRQLEPVLASPLKTEASARGVRSVYAVSGSFALEAGATKEWALIADTGLDHVEVTKRRTALIQGITLPDLQRAATESTRRLRTLVAAADGCQSGGAERTTVHHFANTLFNIMRGGVFANACKISTPDFIAFLRERNDSAADRQTPQLARLPLETTHADLLQRAHETDDRDFQRLALEYLPLTFSRRHGDPSRPWNRFNIHVRDAAGARVLNYEGNWRDIFQNWEALCLSFPEFLESVVAKFLNASTIDGYNPYRISRHGLEWEVPEPDFPWASIGYWGDHQTIYLSKLLEWSFRFHPERVVSWWHRKLFSYADVPYRISNYEAMRQNPRATIGFNNAAHHASDERVRRIGADGRLKHDAEGKIIHVNLGEKLLLLVLTRLTNFVPEGGIWMNTQRPEWNDANNALVGRGVSLVTLCYLRRLLAHLRDHVLPGVADEPLQVSSPLATLARRVSTILSEHASDLNRAEMSNEARRQIVDALATAGSDYREAVYREASAAESTLALHEITELVQRAIAACDRTIRASQRPDGLYHSYSLLRFADESTARLELQPLGPMLEGQVAVLSSGVLPPEEAVRLLTSLRKSPLYRPDQHSYLLYPDRIFPSFLERNRIPETLAASCPLFATMVETRDHRLVNRDADGVLRFNADLVNEEALIERLANLRQDPRWASVIQQYSDPVRAVYVATFHHDAYTGRSGSMFGYEGLGCIYWHMVAKLAVAVQENLQNATAGRSPAAPQLAAHYDEIRSGLGFNKTAGEYGAFPTDPYSHTPGHSGAQQPGMTGQVKEEILTRFGELGVSIRDGRLELRPCQLKAEEFTTGPGEFHYVDTSGVERSLRLPSDSLAFTYCNVPIVYRSRTPQRADGAQNPLEASGYSSPHGAIMRLTFADGSQQTFPEAALDRELSDGFFQRTGRIARIDLDLPI